VELSFGTATMPKRKLPPELMHEIMDEYNIFFDRPFNPLTLPVQYAELFRQITVISRLGFDEYALNENRSLLLVANFKKRYWRHLRTVDRCVKRRGNEATWRAYTDPEVFARFEAEVIW
jgi:hypothetical protein